MSTELTTRRISFGTFKGRIGAARGITITNGVKFPDYERSDSNGSVRVYQGLGSCVFASVKHRATQACPSGELAYLRIIVHQEAKLTLIDVADRVARMIPELFIHDEKEVPHEHR